jgi:hypothetical protein
LSFCQYRFINQGINIQPLQGCHSHSTPPGLPTVCVLFSMHIQPFQGCVFPNPSCGSINIAYSLQEFSSISFELFDIQGKKMIMASLNPEERQLNIEDLQLENGVYFYSITGDGKNLMTKKLVVVK